jgi:hypothetical protein
MSDLPQVDTNGGERRSEILAATREASVLAVDLVHRAALTPFARGVALRGEALTVDGVATVSFGHLLVARRGPLPELRALEPPGLGIEIEIFAIAALSAGEVETVADLGADAVAAELAGDPLIWLLDERLGLEPLDAEREVDREAVAAASPCLEEATASPCPRCGGGLKERRLEDADDPFLVCSACGWSRAESAAQHIAPYRWALDRLRRELGSERVDWDVRPDGDGAVLRVETPGRPPALIELKSPVYDLNRRPDRERELERKLAGLRAFLEGNEGEPPEEG